MMEDEKDIGDAASRPDETLKAQHNVTQDSRVYHEPSKAENSLTKILQGLGLKMKVAKQDVMKVFKAVESIGDNNKNEPSPRNRHSSLDYDGDKTAREEIQKMKGIPQVASVAHQVKFGASEIIHEANHAVVKTRSQLIHHGDHSNNPTKRTLEEEAAERGPKEDDDEFILMM